MKILLYFAVGAVIIFVFCLLPLKVHVSLVQQGSTVNGKIVLRILGFLGYTFKIPSSKDQGMRESEKQKASRGKLDRVPLPPQGRRWEFLKAFVEINRWLVGCIKCKNFFWKTSLSLGDAAATGIAGGLLWSLKGFLVSLLKRTLDAEHCQTEILITPVFNGPTIATEFDCIFSLRTGYIIIAGMRLLVLAIIFILVLKGAKAA